ncbi:LOW QUALITY PROTEIN: hypothetical protein PHMEG_00039836 [Phytophthora megakarya]|uniref:Uncharacterized protein n=1 Tax=Phytophthora megakarya TaxID=4795 RepID=A0A225UF09_9STRA|nr:LOW QUALITY PROTEIN: hypothetical protein PHMEG_00039836 [Phytophthora megakarya]
MRECLMALGIQKSQVLKWSSELQRHATEKELEISEQSDEKFTREEKLINHQNCVISELMAMNRSLAKRVSELERNSGDGNPQRSSPLAGNEGTPQDRLSRSSPTAKTCGSKAQPKGPASIWFEWYAKTPRLWDTLWNQTTATKFFVLDKKQNGIWYQDQLRKLYRDGNLDRLIDGYRARVNVEKHQ